MIEYAVIVMITKSVKKGLLSLKKLNNIVAERQKERNAMEAIILLIGMIGFAAALVYSIIVKVPDVHYGLPSSLFGGRFKREKDNTGNSIPIHEPYSEGFHLKAPWWKVTFISKEVRVKDIKRREFPTKDGGTVLISGVIQYRPSRIVLYRYAEVDEEGINNGLDSELNQIVGRFLAMHDLEESVSRRQEISQNLSSRLNGLVLNPNEVVSVNGQNQPAPEVRRILFDKKITYSEHSYGIETLKASIDTIEPEEVLKKAREDQRKEQYERSSQTTEWEHLIKKMEFLKEKFPGLDDKLALEAVQVWQKQASKDIKEFKIADLKEFGEAIASILKGGK